MAYLKSIEFKGMTIENAYHRLDSLMSEGGSCKASLNKYVSRESYLNSQGFLEQEQVIFPIVYGSDVGSDKNQGYEYLLSLEENNNVVSVFEEGQPN